MAKMPTKGKKMEALREPKRGWYRHKDGTLAYGLYCGWGLEEVSVEDAKAELKAKEVTGK